LQFAVKDTFKESATMFHCINDGKSHLETEVRKFNPCRIWMR